MGTQLKNNKNQDLNSYGSNNGIHSKLKIALAEANMDGLDIQIISLAPAPGFLALGIAEWLDALKRPHEGKVSVIYKHLNSVDHFNPSYINSFSKIDDTIKTQEFNEILVVGGEISFFSVANNIYLQRDKRFVDYSNRVARSMSRITQMLIAIRESNDND